MTVASLLVLYFIVIDSAVGKTRTPTFSSSTVYNAAQFTGAITSGIQNIILGAPIALESAFVISDGEYQIDGAGLI